MYDQSDITAKDVSILYEYVYQISQHAYVLALLHKLIVAYFLQHLDLKTYQLIVITLSGSCGNS